AIMQLPGGLLADRLGSRRVMTGAILGWSIWTALTGVASSLPQLLAIRVLFGISEGPFPPSASKTIALSFPKDEVRRANGLQLAAVEVGAAIAPALVSWIILAWSWRAVFYSFLAPGLILALLIWRFIEDRPASTEEQEEPASIPASSIAVREVLQMPAVL